MNGKVCVVTGATSGIGKATATALARQGAQVVLVGRDRGRSEATAAELAKVAASPPQVEIADLSSMAQVRALADRLNAMDRIDVLINNAGFVAGRRGTTDDGFEEVFAVNHLAPFLLTNLLLGKLTASAPARVITVTSDAHTAAKLDLDDLQLERGWDSWRSYSNSKLANILFTRELARRTAGHRGDRELRPPGSGAERVRARCQPRCCGSAWCSRGRSCCRPSAGPARLCTWPRPRTWRTRPAATT